MKTHMFIDYKNHYFKDVYIIPNTLQSQCNTYYYSNIFKKSYFKSKK